MSLMGYMTVIPLTQFPHKSCSFYCIIFAQDRVFKAACVTPGHAKCIIKAPRKSTPCGVLGVLEHPCFFSLYNESGRELN